MYAPNVTQSIASKQTAPPLPETTSNAASKSAPAPVCPTRMVRWLPPLRLLDAPDGNTNCAPVCAPVLS